MIYYPVGSRLDWDLFMFCQSMTEEKCYCPGALNGMSSWGHDKQSSGGVLYGVSP